MTSSFQGLEAEPDKVLMGILERREAETMGNPKATNDLQKRKEAQEKLETTKSLLRLLEMLQD